MMAFINHPTWTEPDLLFGGTKNSGYGRELTALVTRELVNKKLFRVSSIDALARGIYFLLENYSDDVCPPLEDCNDN
jgi:hypothetical protein